MGSNKWNKVENEAGYPCYVDELTGKHNYDHPDFIRIEESLKVYDGIKYSVYQIAFKIYALQKQLKVPPLHLTSGVFSRHQLSLSESSLSLDTAELEAVLADIYFAAEKEGRFSGDVDLAVDLMINLLLNVYDRDRKEPIRVLAAKTLLILLSEETASDKWAALANCSADHNGCVSPKRLASLLAHVTALSQYLGGSSGQIQNDVDACFEKNAGMLGLTSPAVAEWCAVECTSTRWLPVVQRVAASRRQTVATVTCSNCANQIIQMLKFQCNKCSQVYFCERCYLYDRELPAVGGHKKGHNNGIHEIIDGQTKPAQCMSFIKGMKRFFFCTKTKKRRTNKPKMKETEAAARRRKGDGKPAAAMVTSTVGKASGNKDTNPTNMLQDIINQLETQNKALQDLSKQLKEATANCDDDLKAKVDAHWTQISTQINRLRTLKDNLSSQTDLTTEPTTDKADQPQPFDLLSPILTDDIQSKVTDSLKNQPRVLSLDSGNFSVVSKNADSRNLLTVSGDALKPVVVHTSDSISTVSMNDISSWYNEPQSIEPDKRCTKTNTSRADKPSINITHIAADIRSVGVEHGNNMKELNADLDTVLERLHQILANNFAMDDSCFDNTQLRETANEMEGLLGTLIRGVEARATLHATKGHV